MKELWIVYKMHGSHYVALRAFRSKERARDYANSLSREQTCVEEIEYDSGKSADRCKRISCGHAHLNRDCADCDCKIFVEIYEAESKAVATVEPAVEKQRTGLDVMLDLAWLRVGVYPWQRHDENCMRGASKATCPACNGQSPSR